MLQWIETHPLVTTIVGGAVLGIIGYLFKRFFEPNPRSKNQENNVSHIGGNLQQAQLIVNNSSFQTAKETSYENTRSNLSPSINKDEADEITLGELTRDEKEYLKEFIEQDKSTVERDISDGISHSLIMKGIVTRPAQSVMKILLFSCYSPGQEDF